MRNVGISEKIQQNFMKKSAKSVPGEKSAKRQVLSRAAGGLLYFSQAWQRAFHTGFLIRFWE
jgi:hypothetical protein